MNELFEYLLRLDPVWVYTFVFLFAFIENLFPPSPSDMVIVLGGAIAAMDRGNVVVAIASATTGSLAGFMVMYTVGRWLGERVVEQKRFRFIPVNGIHRIEAWFGRYGYWLIVANRFLSGTRAVISLFAGMSELDLTKTTLLSAVSSLMWNSLLVAAGYSLGHHWQEIGGLLKTYSRIVTGIMIIAVLAFLVLYFVKKRKK